MKTKMHLSLLLVQTLFFLPSAFAAIGSDGICRADNCPNNECVFTVKVKLTAGELGYYKFDECGDVTNPTIGIEMGTTYRFVQVSNSLNALKWKLSK